MMTSFLYMGGYGGFIWPSYVITFIALIWLFLASWHRAKTAAQHLKDAETPNQTTASQQD
jgi:heme exporter protein CcmD